ncbi:hypothetical protein [Streptomyces sp. NPDC058861]|uniref:hypothetical protein n=1 Tax=Streptomyces sp. NPDC058861 TaxID=3346653 RepID=UPI0036CDAD57
MPDRQPHGITAAVHREALDTEVNLPAAHGIRQGFPSTIPPAWRMAELCPDRFVKGFGE